MKTRVFVLFTVFCLLVTILTGCGAAAEDRELVVLTFEFDDGSSCDAYGSGLSYHIEAYNADHVLSDTFSEFTCDTDGDSVDLRLEAGSYYIATELRDSSGNTKTFGETTVTVDNATADTVTMTPYKGGMYLSWDRDMCEEMAVESLTFSIQTGEDPVTTTIWGVETTLDSYTLNCSAGNLPIKNIKDGAYSLTVTGFRTADSGVPRISFFEDTVRKITPGQDTNITLEDPDILVSDLRIVWEFDSKRNATCTEAGIDTVEAKIIEDTASDGISYSDTTPCNVSENEIMFHDIHAADWGVHITGLDGDTEKFHGEIDNQSGTVISVERGHIGKKAAEITVFLVENE